MRNARAILIEIGFRPEKKFVFRGNEMSSPPARWKTDKHSWFIRSTSEPNRNRSLVRSNRIFPRHPARSHWLTFTWKCERESLRAHRDTRASARAPARLARSWNYRREFVRFSEYKLAKMIRNFRLFFWHCVSAVVFPLERTLYTYVIIYKVFYNLYW